MKLDITPGPYKQNLYDHGGSRIYVEDERGRDLICDTYGTKTEALLHLHAPEMLDWLIEDILRAENTWIEMWCENPDNDLDATEAEIRAACRSHENNAKQIAIIEAATGRTWEELNGTIQD